MLTVDQLNRISQSLSIGGKENKYYVYTLRDTNNVTFYVGKGCYDRILQHNIQTLSIQALLAGDDKFDINNIPEKVKKIMELDNNIDYYHIEKWGITEHEALMCESTLINYIESTGIKLTNIVNGHASPGEKLSNATVKTKSRTLTEFLNEVAIPELDITKIPYKVVFIKINPDYYTDTMTNSEIKDQISGCWRISDYKGKRAEYACALCQHRIVGVYKVIRLSETLNNEYKLSQLKDFPKYPVFSRSIDVFKARFNSLTAAKKELTTEQYNTFYKALLFDCKNDVNEMAHRLILDGQRKYFVLDEQVPAEIKELNNHIVINSKNNKFFKTASPVQYNY